VDVAQGDVEIGQILECLHRKYDVEFCVTVGWGRDVRGAAFDPIELGTAVLRCGDLVRADVDGADPTSRADALRRLTGKVSTTATSSNTRSPVLGLSAARTVPRRTTRSCDSVMACCSRAISPVKANPFTMPLLPVRVT
jgi:hypothetical protein